MNSGIKVVVWVSIALFAILAFRSTYSKWADRRANEIRYPSEETDHRIDGAKHPNEIDRCANEINLPSEDVNHSVKEVGCNTNKIVKNSTGVTKTATILCCITSSLFTAYIVASVFVTAMEQEHARFKRVASERAELYKQCNSLKQELKNERHAHNLYIKVLKEKYSRLEVDQLRLCHQLNHILIYNDTLATYLSALEYDNLQSMEEKQKKDFGGYIANQTEVSTGVLFLIALGRIEQRLNKKLYSTLWNTNIHGYNILISSLIKESNSILVKKEKDRLIRKVKVKDQHSDKYEYKLKSVCSVCFEEENHILIAGCKCWAPICQRCFPTIFYTLDNKTISKQVGKLGRPFVGANCPNCRRELSLSLLFALEKHIKDNKLKLNLRIKWNKDRKGTGILGWLFSNSS